MKKLLIALLIILAVATLAIVIFIPSSLTVSHSVVVHSNINSTTKLLADSNAWHRWFPQQKDYAQFPVANDMLFEVDSVYGNAVRVNMTNGKMESSSKLSWQTAGDSTKINWQIDLKSGWNPATRLRNYGYSLQAKQSITIILDSLKVFMNNQPDSLPLQTRL